MKSGGRLWWRADPGDGYLVVEGETRGRGVACGGERRERASLSWRVEGEG